MKKYFKLFALTLIGAISFTACNNELEDNNGNISGAEKEIKIIAGINGLSRTTSADGSLTTTFVKNDEIGIFVYEGDKAVYSNVKYVYNGSSWTSENAINAKTGVQYKYYAYYPYNSEVTDAAKVSVTVKADQTGDYNKEDFLTAQNTEAAAGAENITLNFNHAFSMVQVGIKETATTDVNATVTLENIIPTAEVNVITGAVAAATGEATSVMMKKSATKMEYRAIVPAQTIAANAKLMSITADGKTFAVSNSEAVEYAKGQALQITVNSLNPLPEGNEVTIGGSITDWDKGTDPGDGEVVELPITLLDLTTFPGLDLSEGNQTRIIGKWDTDKAKGKEDFWYIRNTNDISTYSLNNNTLEICNTKQGKWGTDCIAFHSSGIYERSKYILTFEMMSNAAVATVGFGIANSNDDALFQICDNNWANYQRNIHTFKIENKEGQWVSQTMRFDFGYDFAGGYSSNIVGPDEEGERKFSITDDNDVNKGINLIFYNYTPDKNITGTSSLYLRNIKLTKYIEE